MRSGSGSGSGPNENNQLPSQDEVFNLVNLFVSNAVITAGSYSRFCERNSITKEDLNYGLKYEVLKFFSRPTLMDDYNEMKKEIESIHSEEPILYRIEYFNKITGNMDIVERDFKSEDDAEKYINDNLENRELYDDVSIMEFTESDLLMENMTTNIEEPFAKITEEQIGKLSNEDKTLVEEIHRINNEWKTWTPVMPLQKMMKDLLTKHDIINII